MLRHLQQASAFSAFAVLLISTMPAQEQQPENAKPAEPLEQILQRAVIVWVAKVQPGVTRDWKNQPVRRIVKVEKILSATTSMQDYPLTDWFAPMQDLGTDDYCIMVGMEIQSDIYSVPPVGDFQKDVSDPVDVKLDESQPAIEISHHHRIAHPTKSYPTLEEALAQGYVVNNGKKIPMKTIGTILAEVRARESKNADPTSTQASQAEAAAIEKAAPTESQPMENSTERPDRPSSGSRE